jgi:hypothetical protein
MSHSLPWAPPRSCPSFEATHVASVCASLTLPYACRATDPPAYCEAGLQHIATTCGLSFTVCLVTETVPKATQRIE